MTKILNDLGEWKVFEKANRGGGGYATLHDKMLVIVPRQKSLGYFYVTPAVLKALGNPTHVILANNGKFMGVVASNGLNPDAYMVVTKKSMSLPTITASAFLRQFIEHKPYPLYYAVEYDAIRNMVWFNVTQPMPKP